MTQKELIRQEIERRIRSIENCPFIEAALGAYEKRDRILMVYKDLLTFIDSLPEEKLSEELEEAAEELFETIEIQEHENIFEDTFKKIFIAGAEWMRKKDVEDMYMSDNRHFLKCYEQGKVDMRVEMMKDAVEGEVYKFGDTAYVKENNNADLTKYLSKFDNGDKVKIIVIKQKEQHDMY